MWFRPSLSWSNSAERSQCINGLIFHVSHFLLPLFLFPPTVFELMQKGWVENTSFLLIIECLLLLPLLLHLHLLIPVSLSPASSAFSFVTPSRHSRPPTSKGTRGVLWVFFFPMLSSACGRRPCKCPCARAVASKTRQNLKRSGDLRPSVITGDRKWRGGSGKWASGPYHLTYVHE